MQMVESAVSTDRVAEALEAIAPMAPNTSFFRLQVCFAAVHYCSV